MGLRVKTSVTIDEAVLRAIDKTTSRSRSRSRIIEEAAREFLARRTRAAREARDLAILNEAADALNREMQDVLSYQADLWSAGTCSGRADRGARTPGAHASSCW